MRHCKNGVALVQKVRFSVNKVKKGKSRRKAPWR